MPLTLKSSGLATDLVVCVAVQSDNTITEFKGNSISLDTGVAASVGTDTWKGSSRKYFSTTDGASETTYYGVRFNTTRPQYPTAAGGSVFAAFREIDSDTDLQHCLAEIGLEVGDNVRGLWVTTTNASRKARFDFNSGAACTIGSTTIPAATKLSIGANYTYNSNAQIFYGAESGSLATDSTAANPGTFGSIPFDIFGLGGAVGSNTVPADWFIFAVFDRELTTVEMQSLHNDWANVLFDGAEEEEPPALMGQACL
jgi:hypothetical protein